MPIERDVIAVRPSGDVEFLRGSKTPELLDLAGVHHEKAVMRRITEIFLRSEDRKFYVKWLRGPLRDNTLSMVQPTFDTYEDAVAYEQSEVRELLKRGYTFDD